MIEIRFEGVGQVFDGRQVLGNLTCVVRGGQIALAWMLCKKPYIAPIPGTRKIVRLKKNAGAADIALSAAEVAAIDEKLSDMPMSAVFGGSGS